MSLVGEDDRQLDPKRGTLRVLLVTTSFVRGGAETQVFLLARAFQARGHTVHVVSMLAPDAYQPELAELGIELTSLDMTRGQMDIRALTSLAAIVRRWRPDVVHSHMVHANLLSRTARPLGWAPVQVSTAHGLSEGGRWRYLAYRATDPLCTLTTHVCNACVDHYVELGVAPRGKMAVVPNGIDIDAFRAPKGAREALRQELGLDSRFAWLAVGRLDVEKDHETMFRAAATLRDEATPFTVLVVGDGPERDRLLAERERLGLSDVEVRFLGARSDVPELLAAADGYLMTSSSEALPLVLLEASAAGLPIVSTDVGGTSEIVLNGRSGLLAPVGSDDELAIAMRRLMDATPDERRAMGGEGRRIVRERFDIEHVADVWVDLYRDLASRGRAR